MTIMFPLYPTGLSSGHLSMGYSQAQKSAVTVVCWLQLPNSEKQANKNILKILSFLNESVCNRPSPDKIHNNGILIPNLYLTHK